MKIEYPNSFKEMLVMTSVNCVTMVCGMMGFNLWYFGALTLENFCITFLPMFFTARTLDFIVEKIVNKIVAKFKCYKIMLPLRVLMMAGILTFLAPIIESGTIVSGTQYIMTLPRNYILAFLLQRYIAFPLGVQAMLKLRA